MERERKTCHNLEPGALVLLKILDLCPRVLGFMKAFRQGRSVQSKVGVEPTTPSLVDHD